MKATLSYYCSVRKWPLDLPESLSWDVCYKIGMPFPNGWLVGYENFPFVITENQSQIPPWVSLVKVKNKLKKHECRRHECFLNLFFLSLVTLRQEFDSDFLWSLMGNFHTPSRHPLGNTTFLYSKWDFTTEPTNGKFPYLLLVLSLTVGYDHFPRLASNCGVWPFPTVSV